MMRSVGTLTRADLAETINRKMGFSRAESLALVEAILAKMSARHAARWQSPGASWREGAGGAREGLWLSASSQ